MVPYKEVRDYIGVRTSKDKKRLIAYCNYLKMECLNNNNMTEII